MGPYVMDTELAKLVKLFDDRVNLLIADDCNAYNIREKLARDYFYTVLGDGYFSTVFALNDEYAIKLSRLAKIDNCRFYYNFCMANKSPLLPQIYCVRDLPEVNAYYAVLPRYKKQHIDGESNCYSSEDSINPPLYTLLDTINSFGNKRYRSHTKRELYYKLRERLMDHYHYEGDPRTGIVDTQLKEHRKVIRMIYRINCYMSSICKEDDWSFDLHGQNVMFTYDNKLVITDPVS